MICHLPPPTTGAAMVSQFAVNAGALHKAFNCDVIPIHMTGEVGELGRLQLSKILNSFKIYFCLFWLLATRRVDAVYITVAIGGFAILRDYGSVLICRLFNVKPIFHIHMRGISARYKASLFYRRLYHSLFAGVEVIHLSPLLYEDVASVVPPDRFHVVANGVPDPLIGLGEVSKKARDVPMVLFLSNLMHQKGPLNLLEASQRLFDEGVDHRIVFVGAPNEPEVMAAIKAAVAKNEDRIALVGPLYGMAKNRLLAEADIFAFPTFYEHECQPLSLIEAMGSGVPVVASCLAGIPDLVHDGVEGLLFEPGNSEQLSFALKRLLTDTILREKMGQAGRRAYLSFYTIDAFEKRFSDMMSGLVPGKVA